jgi:hypothetical protein
LTRDREEFKELAEQLKRLREPQPQAPRGRPPAEITIPTWARARRSKSGRSSRASRTSSSKSPSSSGSSSMNSDSSG